MLIKTSLLLRVFSGFLQPGILLRVPPWLVFLVLVMAVLLAPLQVRPVENQVDYPFLYEK